MSYRNIKNNKKTNKKNKRNNTKYSLMPSNNDNEYILNSYLFPYNNVCNNAIYNPTRPQYESINLALYNQNPIISTLELQTLSELKKSKVGRNTMNNIQKYMSGTGRLPNVFLNSEFLTPIYGKKKSIEKELLRTYNLLLSKYGRNFGTLLFLPIWMIIFQHKKELTNADINILIETSHGFKIQVRKPIDTNKINDIEVKEYLCIYNKQNSYVYDVNESKTITNFNAESLEIIQNIVLSMKKLSEDYTKIEITNIGSETQYNKLKEMQNKIKELEISNKKSKELIKEIYSMQSK